MLLSAGEGTGDARNAFLLFVTSYRTVLRFHRHVSSVALVALLWPGARLAADAVSPVAPEIWKLIASARHPDLAQPELADVLPALSSLYTGRQGRPLWVDGDRPTPGSAKAVRVLANADRVGLDPQRYESGRWGSRFRALRTGDPGAAARFDVALSATLARYARDVHEGRVAPAEMDFDVGLPPPRLDLARVLAEVAVSPTLESDLGGLEPPFAAYRSLRAALPRYRELARLPFTPLPEVEKLEPGQPYAESDRLAERLESYGDLAPGLRLELLVGVYGPELARGVERFQERHGLLADGIVGARTWKALNTPPAERVQQIELTLERWRWLRGAFSASPIVVNLPEFTLRAMRFEEGDLKTDLTMRVVVGQGVKNETPVFAGRLQWVVFRPTWSVPTRIAEEEVLPEIDEDPDLIETKGYELIDASGKLHEPTEENLEAARKGRLVVRQRPGAKNPLGKVKFLFPNRYDVYLHDSPAKYLFARARRAFSHGCIRVEDPEALAAWVLADRPEWPKEKVAAAMNGEKTLNVPVARTIPVFILYATAVAGEDGQVSFYEDLYGYDAELEKALGA